MRLEDLSGKDPRDMAPGPDCLSDAAIARLATGSDAGGAALDHLAACDRCGTRLQMVMEPETLTAEEAALAARLAAPRLAAMPQRRRPLVPVWFAAAASVAAIISGTAVWRWWTNVERQSGSLLARAYTESRQIEWRFPDAGWTRVAAQRGGGGARSAALAEAQGALARSDSSEPGVALLRARADLMDFRIESAIPLLEKAAAASPDSVEILTDLAIAHGLRADRLSQPEGYGAAVEFSTRALRIDPKHRRARYNRALAFERLRALERAAEEWRTFLETEPDSGWADEAREHFADLERRLRERGDAIRGAAAADMVFEGKAVEWLATDRARARQAGLRLLEDHGDAWLANAAGESVDSSLLRDAWAHSAAGRPDEALAGAIEALAAYSGPGRAPAHASFARLVRTIAWGRRLDASLCASEGRALAEDAAAMRFHWIRTQALSQAASCLQVKGDIGASMETYEKALAAARAARLTGVELQTGGIYSTVRTRSGDLWSAWNENRGFLGRAYASPYSANRVQQALANYSLSAEAWGWRAAAAEFAAASANSIRESANRTMEMANRSRAASLAASVGDDALASRQAAIAEGHFAAMPESETRRRYLASLDLTRAEAWARTGRRAEAAAKLRDIAGSLAVSRDRWRAYSLSGKLEREAGRRDEAFASLNAAVAEAGHMEGSLPPKQRAAARREALEAYRGLAEMLVERGAAAEALKVWLAAHGSDAAPSMVLLGLADGFAVWTGGGRIFQKVVLDRERFRALVQAFREAVEDRSSRMEEVQRLGVAVHEALFSRLRGETWDEENATVLPDGETGAIPFDLVLHLAGRRTGAASSIVMAARPGEPRVEGVVRALVIAAPASGDHLAPLPDSLAEGEEVAANWSGSTMVSGSGAGAASLLRELPRHGLFHFSGHGYHASGASGLWLAGGPLGSGGLRSVEAGACRLVVLSACMTAVGSGAGLTNPESLVNAFLEAGVPAVMASRWSVDSAATRRLMRQFHRELAASGAVRPALARASSRLRSDPGYAHPYYWAAFQIYL